MAGETILIIDPSQAEVLSLIEDLLYPEGYVVFHSLDAADGLRQAMDENPDLIFADFATLTRSGPNVIEQLRQAGREVPVILTGVSAAAESYRWALRMGAVDYLLKPLDLEESRSAVRRALAQKAPPSLAAEGGLLARGYRQLNRQLERRVRELSILNDLGKAVTSVRDLERLLNRVVEAAVYLTQAEEGFILLVDKESDELYMRAGQGLGKKFASGFRVKSTDSLFWEVVQTGEPVLLDRDKDEEQLKVKTGYLVNALLHVPLKLSGEVVGVLSVDNRTARRRFEDNHTILLSALADYAAIAIDNVQQYERAAAETARLAELLSARASQAPLSPQPAEDARLRRQVSELSILHDLGRAVTSVRDLEKLLKRVVEAGVYLTRAEEGFLLLMDEETNELYMRAGQGLGKKFAKGFRVKSTDSLVLQVMQTGEPVMIGNSPEEEQLKIKTGYLVRALLHVPLMLRGEAIGVLSVDHRITNKSFTESDKQLLSTLADYAAIAIDNVQQIGRAETEAAKLAELLTAQAELASAGQEEESKPQVEPVALDWLVQELRARQELAEERWRETERLARDMTAQVSAIERLADGWRSQQVETEELAHRLAAVVVTASGASPEGGASALADLQETLNSLGEGLVVANREGIVTMANEAAAQLLDSDSLVGQELRRVSSSAHWAKSVDRVLSSGTQADSAWQEVSLWSRGKLVKAVFLPLSREEERGWAVVFRDLFQERPMQLAVEDIAAAVSEEFRTPMTIISSYTDMLLAENVGLLVPAQRRLLDSMRTNLARMSGLLKEPVAISPTAADIDNGSFASADLNAILRDALADSSSLIDERRLQVELEMVEGPPRVAVQPDCVYQMVINLLQNAARATPDGGTIVIRASASSDGRAGEPPHVIISVRDQGGGIAPEFLSHVFERFYSEAEQPIPGLGGKGVELSAAKTLVEAFGGRVWVETEPGVGSTFSAVLPAVVAH